VTAPASIACEELDGFRTFAQGPGSAEKGLGLHEPIRLPDRASGGAGAERAGQGAYRTAGAQGRPCQGQGGGPVEPLSARRGAWQGAEGFRIRTALRNHGKEPDWLARLQLYGARYR